MTTRLLPLLTSVLLLVGSVASAQAPDVVFANGVVHNDPTNRWFPNRHATLTFGPDSLTLATNGEPRWFRRGPKQTLTIPYADVLSASLDEGPVHCYLVIRYRRQRAGEAVRLDVSEQLVQRVVATLEARSGVGITDAP